MDLVTTGDTVLTSGPGLMYRVVGILPRGAVVRSVERRDSWLRLESGSTFEQAWVEERLTQQVHGVVPSVSPHGQYESSAPQRLAQAATRSSEVSWSWGPRLVGALQLVGGVMEVALGVGGVAIPTPVTAVGGIILVAHGSDTIIAGIRTLWSGEVAHSFTQTGVTMAAESAGASPQAAQRVGIGVDLLAGAGPSIGMSVTRRLAIAGAESATHTVAVAYLHRSALAMGHNAVGVRTGGTMAWVHFAGIPEGAVTAARAPGAQYAITELAVTGAQAARAVTMQRTLIQAGVQTWRYAGPNCTTTALQVLRQGGVVVPAWSVSPGLLHLGVRAGAEVTFMAGTIGSTAPDVMGVGQPRRR